MTPAPTPAQPSDLTGPLLHGMWLAVSQTASQHPWSVALLVTTVVVGGGRRMYVAALAALPRDPVRRYAWADKQVLLRQAGHRCEHHGLIGGRCPSVERLEADHVRPWSRGGRTQLTNGQILCRRHNQAKNARVPSRREARRLAERRTRYTTGHVSGHSTGLVTGHSAAPAARASGLGVRPDRWQPDRVRSDHQREHRPA